MVINGITASRYKDETLCIYYFPFHILKIPIFGDAFSKGNSDHRNIS